MQNTPYYGPPPPPPPKKGISGPVVALIAIGCLGVLAVGGLVVVGAVIGFRSELAKSSGGAAKSDPLTVSLDQRYTTDNKLITVHYPADFAVKKLDDATLLVSRNFPNGEDEGLTLAAVNKPITNDPSEFARLLWALVDKNVTTKGGTSAKTGERKTLCLGKYPGVEVEGTFSLPGGNPYVSKGCFFIRNERGYEMRYDLPQSRKTAEVPLLDRIMDATELLP